MSFSPYNNNTNNNSFSKFNPDNLKKKVRFVDTQNKKFSCDTPGFWQYERKSNVIDTESNLLEAGVGTKTKAKIEMNSYLHPNNYEVSVANVVQNRKGENAPTYFSGYDTSPGRGFGNLNISNSIRVGDFSRGYTKIYKAEKESQLLDRWEFIDDRYAKSDHLVMEIPRGGDSTRKDPNDLTCIDRMEDDKEFNFEYT